MSISPRKTISWLHDAVSQILGMPQERIDLLESRHVYCNEYPAVLMREINKDLSVGSDEKGRNSLYDVITRISETVNPQRDYRIIELGVSDDHKNILFVSSPETTEYIGVDINPTAFGFIHQKLRTLNGIVFRPIVSAFEDLSEPSEVHNCRDQPSVFLCLGWTYGNFEPEVIISTIHHLTKPEDLVVLETATYTGNNTGALLDFYQHILMTRFFDEISRRCDLDGSLKHLWVENGRRRAAVSVSVENNSDNGCERAVVLNVARKPFPHEVIRAFTSEGFEEIAHMLTGDTNIGVFAFRRV